MHQVGRTPLRARRAPSRAVGGCVAALCALLLAACAAPSAQRDSAASAAPAATTTPAGHRRMIALLDDVAREALVDNPFMGRKQPEELRAGLAALPPDTPDLRRWFFHQLLSQHEMRLGNTDAAIEHALAAYQQLEVFEGEIPADKVAETILGVGVAYLRQGEVLNCAQRHTSDSCLLPIREGGVHVEKGPATSAARYFTEVLQHTPADSWWHVKARWLLNLTAMTLGRYPDGVPAAYRIPPSTFESDQPFPRFVEIAPRLGLNSFDVSGGAIAEDLDGDGYLDLLTSTSDTDGPLRLYWNLGDGRFAERSSAAGLDGLRGGLNMVHADYDNDGDADALVLRGAWWRQRGHHPNSLLRNNGDRTFTDVTFDAGLGEVHYPTQTAAWADYDLDGDLDLFVGNESDPNDPVPCQLFRNNGDGTFTDVATQAGVTNDRYAKGVTWGDYDGDRDPDLYVSNLGHRNRLYRNNGDGTFTDVAQQAGVELPIASFPTWFWDFDNDGRLDLFVAGYGGVNLPPDVGFVAASYLGIPNQAEHARLYRGDGRGGFEEVAVERGLARITLPMGANFGDLDNDGYLDFYLGTGYPYFDGLVPNVMYRNREGRRFADVTTAGGFGHLQKGHGIAFADLDNDGDQDVFAQMGGMYPGDAFGNALFENPGFGNQWCKIRLVGTRSNRAGIGSRIRVVIDEDGATREIYRTVNSSGSFGSNPLRQEVGLGRATRIRRLEVYWPTSDTAQVFEDVPAGRLIEITEGQERYGERRLEPAPFAR